MIKHLEKYALAVPLGLIASNISTSIQAVLNKPIAEDKLNIVTTGPQKDAQIYGWKSPIREHTDDTGYFFFMPIHMDAEDSLVINGQTMPLQLNNLYLVDDRISHSTVGQGNTVALFSGSYTEDELSEDLYAQVFNQFTAIATQE